MCGGDNHPNKCLLSRYYSWQQVRHLLTVEWLRAENQWHSSGRTEMRSEGQSPEVRPKPEVNTISPYRNPKSEIRPVLRRARDWPRLAQVTDWSQSETTAAITLTGEGGDHNRAPSICVTTIAFLDVVGDGNRTNRLQLNLEKFGALKPQFAFASSTTWGPVLRPATHSWLEEPVFGRRIDSVSTEINSWLGIETLVRGIDRRFLDITSRLATLRRRVPMPYIGRSCWFHPAAWHKQQLCFLAVLLFGHSCSVWWSARVFLFGWRWCLEYCRQAVHWSSSTISCRTTGWTMWQDITFRTGHPGPHVSLWCIAGDWQSCPCTVPRLSALTQADYTIPVTPPAWFLFFWGNDQSLSENSAGIKKTSHQFILVLSSREVLNSPVRAFFYMFSIFTRLPCRR